MKLGTIVYDNEIYNLDYTTSEEIKQIMDAVESSKQKDIQAGKRKEITDEKIHLDRR